MSIVTQNQKSKVKSQYFLLLLGILLLAAFFRFYRLEEIPPGLYPDVAINGNEALSNPGRVFYPENNGREGLFINLLTISFSLFGISVWSIKAVAAFAGTLTVLGTYVLTKELFAGEPRKQWNNEIIALLAAFFVATSFWHINFSRIGFRAILLPLILVFSFYFLLKFLNNFSRKQGHYEKAVYPSVILAGILFGIGFYTYTSFRMAIFILLFLLVAHWVRHRTNTKYKKILLSSYLLLFYFIFITSLPLAFYFLLNPSDFSTRAVPVSVFAQENPFAAFGESFIRHLAMFNFFGDPNWRHNYSGKPQLFWPVGLLFLIGFCISIKEAFRRFRKQEQEEGEFTHWSLFLLCWFFIMLLPGALTYEGIPHALRTIGVLPTPYIFAAVGALSSYEFLVHKFVQRRIISIFSILVLSFTAFFGYYDYFIAWAKNPNGENAFTLRYVKIGEYLNSLPPERKKYVIVNEPGVPVPFPNGIPMPAQTPMFIERTKYYTPLATYLKPEEINQIDALSRPVIVLMKYDENLANQLQRHFPKGMPRNENTIWTYQLTVPIHL